MRVQHIICLLSLMLVAISEAKRPISTSIETLLQDLLIFFLDPFSNFNLKKKLGDKSSDFLSAH